MQWFVHTRDTATGKESLRDWSDEDEMAARRHARKEMLVEKQTVRLLYAEQVPVRLVPKKEVAVREECLLRERNKRPVNQPFNPGPLRWWVQVKAEASGHSVLMEWDDDHEVEAKTQARKEMLIDDTAVLVLHGRVMPLEAMPTQSVLNQEAALDRMRAMESMNVLTGAKIA